MVAIEGARGPIPEAPPKVPLVFRLHPIAVLREAVEDGEDGNLRGAVERHGHVVHAVDPVGEDLHHVASADAQGTLMPAEEDVLRLVERLLHEPCWFRRLRPKSL
eukprot:15482714-Alexandrium_andersonii.AAC.1